MKRIDTLTTRAKNALQWTISHAKYAKDRKSEFVCTAYGFFPCSQCPVMDTFCCHIYRTYEEWKTFAEEEIKK